MDQRQWDFISKTVSNTRQAERVQQQALYRLMEALQNGDDVLVRKLLDMGVLLDAPLYMDGDTASPLAKDLLPRDYPFPFITPVGWAAFTNNTSVLEKLAVLGADFSFPGPTGRDALWMSLMNNAIAAWDWIKNHHDTLGFDIAWQARSTDGKRTTRLMDAVVRRNLDAVRDVLGNVDVGAMDNTGKTALHYNFLQDPYTEVDVAIGRLLINFGAPVATEDHEGVSPAALAHTPEQQTLLDNAVLAKISHEAFERAQAQRLQLEANKPTPAPDPTEPALPQLQKPRQFRPKM